MEDGRPKALQVETGVIEVQNHALASLFDHQDFKNALKKVKDGWVFKTQDTAQFPHFDKDVQSFASRLRELINHVSQKESVSSVKQLLQNDEDKSKKLDLSAMEGWYIHTGCVHISFAEGYTHEATLHTTQFVDDFPVHLWLFPPRSDVDLNQCSAPSTPSSSPEPLNCDRDPFLSFLAHAPNVIHVELNRAQLLFLMRLKDSITLFKNKLMDFLDTSVIIPPKRATSPAIESLESSSGDDIPKTMSGCVIVEHVQASILLPSIFSPKESNDLQPPIPTEVVGEANLAHRDSDIAKKTTSVSISAEFSNIPEESIDIVQEPTSSSSTFSTSSLTVNLSSTPAQMSSIDMLDKYSEYAPSLPDVLISKATLPRMYNSASNLTSMPSSSTHPKIEKTRSSNSLSSLIPDRSASTGTCISPSVATITPPPPLATAIRSNCSLVDDFVIVESPSPTSISQIPSLQLPADNLHTERAISPSFDQAATKKSRKKRQMRSPPPLSERKVRSSSPKSEPQYNLCISVEGIHALPNIVTSGTITARCSINVIDIREIKNSDFSKYKEDLMCKRKPQQDQHRNECVHPVIKLRIELGDQVARFFDKSVTEADVILILKATGLEVGLLTQNMDVMKQFFDDEFEAELPVPVHIRVDNTKLTILDSPENRADDWKCMQVKINQADIHRGKSLAKGLNIFMDSVQTAKMSVRRLSMASTQDTTR